MTPFNKTLIILNKFDNTERVNIDIKFSWSVGQRVLTNALFLDLFLYVKVFVKHIVIYRLRKDRRLEEKLLLSD